MLPIAPIVTSAESSGGFVIQNRILTKYTGTGSDVIIPDGVTGIGDFAFQNCRNLASIALPDSLTTIGKEAFVLVGIGHGTHKTFTERNCRIDIQHLAGRDTFESIIDMRFL